MNNVFLSLLLVLSGISSVLSGMLAVIVRGRRPPRDRFVCGMTLLFFMLCVWSLFTFFQAATDGGRIYNVTVSFLICLGVAISEVMILVGGNKSG